MRNGRPIAAYLSQPRGFCAGVVRAIEIVEDALDQYGPHVSDIQGPDIRDICYATQNRQSAVRHLRMPVDVILAVGAANGSNSERLHEIGREVGVASHLVVDGEFEPRLDQGWVFGITAGASAPEGL